MEGAAGKAPTTNAVLVVAPFVFYS
jgi:hypothetical protein